MARKKCEDCGVRCDELHKDPRDPPLKYPEPCLCEDCMEGALTSEIERLEDEIRDKEREIDSLKKKRRG